MNQADPKTRSKPKPRRTTKSEKQDVERQAELLASRAIAAYRKPCDSRDFLYWNK